MLRAEVARQRGRLDVALRHAESWHDSRVDDASYTGRSARANALLLSALVRADEVRAAQARELVAEAEHATGSPETVFHHLTPERVRAYIQACTDRSRPA